MHSQWYEQKMSHKLYKLNQRQVGSIDLQHVVKNQIEFIYFQWTSTPFHPSKSNKHRFVGKLMTRCLWFPSSKLYTIVMIGTSPPKVTKYKLNPLYFQQLYIFNKKFNEVGILWEDVLSTKLTLSQISQASITTIKRSWFQNEKSRDYFQGKKTILSM